jgi:hypothetical protein
MPEEIWREGDRVRRCGKRGEEGSGAEGCDRVLSPFWEVPSEERQMKMSNVWGLGLHLQKSADSFQLWLAHDGHHVHQPSFARVSIVLPTKE